MNKQNAAIKAVADAIVESVREAGDMGAPSGFVYAALMGHMNLDTYYQFIAALVKLGLLRQEGDLLYACK